MPRDTKNERSSSVLRATCYVRPERSAGFIRLILLIIVGLILLGYFGVNIREVLASPVVRDNLSYAWNLAKEIWGNYLAGPVMWVWEHILKFFWELFLEGLDNLRDGNGPSSLIPSA